MVIATCVGFMFGGMLGSRFAADKFIAMNHHSKFSSTMQAQVCTYIDLVKVTNEGEVSQPLWH